MAKFDRITSNPAIMNRQPTIRGMRLTEQRVLEALTIYPNRDDLRREYPQLESEDIRQALAFGMEELGTAALAAYDAETLFHAMAVGADRARAS